jgi:ABC-type Na+ efflux pump permease subunit
MNASLRLAAAAALLAAWVGAAVLMAASVAPAAFAVLPSRALAGNVVGKVLPVILLGGVVVGLVSAGLTWPGPGGRLRAGLALLVSVACGVAQFVIGPKLARLRAQLGPDIEALPVDDLQRVAFGKLHGFSVLWMGVAVLAALLVVGLCLNALRARS